MKKLFQTLNQHHFKIIFVLAILLPIIINSLIYFVYNENILFFLIIFTNLYYVFFFFVYYLIKILKRKSEPRSSIKFVRSFNKTGIPIFWDEHGKDLRHLTGVEVGVDSGKNALQIYKNLNITKLYLVDPWDEYYDYITGKKLRDKEEQNKKYDRVQNLFKKFKNVEIIRKTSAEASKDFGDESLDFVYLDGDHSYEAVKIDLNSWYPKLKQYGVMCGDDYGHITGRGVIEAVNEFAFEKKIVIITGPRSQFWFVKTKKN